MNLRALSILSLAALFTGAVVASNATPADASHSWGSYHWARTSAQQNDAGGFNLKIVDSVIDSWDSYLDEARNDWTSSAVLDLVEEPGNTGSKDRRRCTAISGKVRVCNADYGRNGWLGLAQIWISSSHITQGVTKMNDSYLNNDYNTPAWRRLVMCQEVGHAFGLGHQDEDFYNANLGSCMDYSADPDGPPSNEHPNNHDYDQLSLIYGSWHADTYGSATDGSSTIGAGSGTGPGNSEAAGGNSPADWGRPIRSDKQGNPNLYRKDLGGGRLLFTWVLSAGAARGGQH
jgi:hypothetical protein